MTPFKVVYRREPLPLVPCEIGSAANREVEIVLQERYTILQELKSHLQFTMGNTEMSHSRRVTWCM